MPIRVPALLHADTACTRLTICAIESGLNVDDVVSLQNLDPLATHQQLYLLHVIDVLAVNYCLTRACEVEAC